MLRCLNCKHGQPPSGGFFVALNQKRNPMTRDELIRIALRYETNMADAMLKALGVVRSNQGKTRDRSAKSRKYRGARKLMAQKYGVRM